MKQKLFFVKYDDNCTDCPVYTGGKFFKDNLWTEEHEWDFEDPNPEKFLIKSKYSLKLDESSLNIDYSNQNYVSENFLQILDECKIAYRAIPQEILLKGNKKPKKAYFILLLKDRIFLLDKNNSMYTVAEDPNNKNEPLFEEFFPNEYVYESIEKFIVKKSVTFPEFFICAELKVEICTDRFKNLCEKNKIIGIKFLELSDGFRYNPWEEFDSLLVNRI